MADDQIENLKLPPHSIEAEQSLLGGLLIDNSALDQIADTVSSKDFYRQDHRLIFIHINKLIDETNPADVITVAESLEKKSPIERGSIDDAMETMRLIEKIYKADPMWQEKYYK